MTEMLVDPQVGPPAPPRDWLRNKALKKARGGVSYAECSPWAVSVMTEMGRLSTAEDDLVLRPMSSEEENRLMANMLYTVMDLLWDSDYHKRMPYEAARLVDKYVACMLSRAGAYSGWTFDFLAKDPERGKCPGLRSFLAPLSQCGKRGHS